jgi:hypothetical protein
MSTLSPNLRTFQPARATDWDAVRADPALQAHWILRIGFTVAPIIAGLDKFAHVLVDWDKYLAPQVATLFGGAHGFMLVVGVIEVVAGVGVLLLPRIFGYVVCLWLLGIIVNLLMIPGYYDIALRDLGLSLGALALARLSTPRTYGTPSANGTAAAR